ncbi:hypothetical protein GCM10011312_15650 [Planktosalinus lacus]|uniref:Uncharacterized protein n=1 Tax=Planktosalinus lacus TaxID=1526573 RepID=A0A8J2YAS6_9FLAO|nr:hypothetical protein GCM10011312_15650 [Planktosalinus lacus]
MKLSCKNIKKAEIPSLQNAELLNYYKKDEFLTTFNKIFKAPNYEKTIPTGFFPFAVHAPRCTNSRKCTPF